MNNVQVGDYVRTRKGKTFVRAREQRGPVTSLPFQHSPLSSPNAPDNDGRRTFKDDEKATHEAEAIMGRRCYAHGCKPSCARSFQSAS
jgi:hypothetical protein